MEPQVDQQLQIVVETDQEEMTWMCSASTDIQEQICECIWCNIYFNELPLFNSIQAFINAAYMKWPDFIL